MIIDIIIAEMRIHILIKEIHLIDITTMNSIVKVILSLLNAHAIIIVIAKLKR